MLRVPLSIDDFSNVDEPYVGKFTYGINGDAPLIEDTFESSDE